MAVPVATAGGSGSENKVPRLNSSGLLPASMGGSASTLATLDSGGKVPSTQAPAKAVYSTGGAQALTPSDIGAIDSSTVLLLDGSQPMTGALDAGNHQVTNIADGTNADDAASVAQTRLAALTDGGAKTTSFTAVWGETYRVDASSGAIAITLPSCTGSQKVLEIIRVDGTVANAVAIQRAGSDTLNGGTSLLVPAQYEVAGIRDMQSGKAIKVW